MTDYWLGWNSYDSYSEFELHSPWWCSGWGEDYRTMVAAVRANSEDDAWDKIANAYDIPLEFVDERFISELDGKSPFTDRFQKSDWMAWDENRTCGCGDCPQG